MKDIKSYEKVVYLNDYYSNNYSLNEVLTILKYRLERENLEFNPKAIERNYNNGKLGYHLFQKYKDIFKSITIQNK